jgi:hypothetical protein
VSTIDSDAIGKWINEHRKRRPHHAIDFHTALLNQRFTLTPRCNTQICKQLLQAKFGAGAFGSVSRIAADLALRIGIPARIARPISSGTAQPR